MPGGGSERSVGMRDGSRREFRSEEVVVAIGEGLGAAEVCETEGPGLGGKRLPLGGPATIGDRIGVAR